MSWKILCVVRQQAAERTRAVLTLIDGRLVFSVALDVLGEPLVKLVVGIKQRRHDEVQQGPQLRDSNNIQSSTVLSCSHEHTHTHTRQHTHTHTSAIVFWMGVPVSSSLFRHWNCRRIFHRTLKTRRERVNGWWSITQVYHQLTLNCSVITPITQTVEHRLYVSHFMIHHSNFFQDVLWLVL